MYVGRNGSAGAGFNFIRTGSKTGGTDFEVVFIKENINGTLLLYKTEQTAAGGLSCHAAVPHESSR